MVRRPWLASLMKAAKEREENMISNTMNALLRNAKKGDVVLVVLACGVKIKGNLLKYTQGGSDDLDTNTLFLQNFDPQHDDPAKVKVTTHAIDADEITVVTTFEVAAKAKDMPLRRAQPRRRDRHDDDDRDVA